MLTATCALRWTSLRARGNPLLWTLYAAFAWLPVAMLLQLARDASFTLTGEWALGRAPIHALGLAACPHLSRPAQRRAPRTIELYLPLRQLHIGCAVLPISLFALRGALMLADSPWQRNEAQKGNVPFSVFAAA